MGDDGISKLVSSFKNSETRFGFLQSIERSLEKFFWDLNDDKEYQDESYGGDKEFGLHPSELCYGVCPTRLLWGLYEIRPDYPEEAYVHPKLRRVFDNGNDVHTRWQKYFCKAGFDVIGSWKCRQCLKVYGEKKEIHISELPKKCSCGCKSFKYNEYKLRSEEYMITGKRDLKVNLNGKVLLGEIKSINTFSFKKLKGPKKEHKLQFDLYNFLDNTEEGFFIYEDKNTQEYKMFHNKVSYTEEFNNILTTSKEIKTAYDDSQVVVTKYDQCGVCPWRKVCPTIKSFNDVEKLQEENNESL
jgi:hypothetical protein